MEEMDKIMDEISGATYYIVNARGEACCLSIGATQATRSHTTGVTTQEGAQSNAHITLWAGAYGVPGLMDDWFNHVNKLLKEKGGFDMTAHFPQPPQSTLQQAHSHAVDLQQEAVAL